MALKEYMKRTPLLSGLIGANIGVAFLIWISGIFYSPVMESRLLSFLVIPSDWGLFITRPWTAVSYMFTQSSFLHLLFNMLWLFWFGRIFLFCSTEKKLLLTYLGGGLAGAVFYIAVSILGAGNPGGFLIGSSAAVLAVMTAASVMAPNLELHMLLLGEIRLKYVALLCIVLTFLGIGGGNAGGFSAHFGGVIFGLLAPSILKANSPASFSSESPLDWMRNKWHKMRMRTKKRRVPEAFANPNEISERMRKTSSSLSDEERLDELLDKVRISGYDSLSSAEKRELNSISSRL